MVDVRCPPKSRTLGRAQAFYTSHSLGCTGTSPTVCSASAAANLALFRRAIATYLTTEPLYIPSWTMVPVTTGTVILHPRARSGSCLTMTKPSIVRELGNTFFLWRQRRFDIGSHMWPIFQTAAPRGLVLPHLASRPKSKFIRYKFQPSAFCEVAVSCRMVMYLLFASGKPHG